MNGTMGAWLRLARNPFLIGGVLLLADSAAVRPGHVYLGGQGYGEGRYGYA